MFDHTSIRGPVQRALLNTNNASYASIGDSQELVGLGPQDAEGEALPPGYPQHNSTVTKSWGGAWLPDNRVVLTLAGRAALAQLP